MTALAPSYLWTSTSSATVTSPDTLGNLGFVAGDLLVIGQFGQGSGTATPVAPTINGSNAGFTDGPGAGGSDLYIATSSGAQRTQVWSKILSSGDLAFTVTVNKTGYSGTFHRMGIGKLHHADGFDTTRLYQTLYIAGFSDYGPRSIIGASYSSGKASIQFSAGLTTIVVGDLIQVEGMSNSGYDGWFVVTDIVTTSVTNDTLKYVLATNPGGSSSGAQVTKAFKFNNPTRPACAIWFMSFSTGGVSVTCNIDGALSGSNYHRVPYFQSGTGSTDTDAVHGHHYQTGTVTAQGDFQEYDTADTPLGVTINNNMAGTSQAVIFALYQTAAAPAYLEGKMPTINNMKGNLRAGFTELNGKLSTINNMKGDLFTSAALSGKMPAISDMGAPDGIGEVAGPGTDPIQGKMSNILSMKGDLLVISPNYLSGKSKNILNMRGVLDFGMIAPIIGGEPNLVWDKLGERSYQRGLDRGVLYLQSGKAVVWNGLTEITEKANGSSEPVYFDGMKIGESVQTGAFEGTLKAVTYPDEFSLLEGGAEMRHGVLLTNQRPKAFHLSYRTLIGNDLNPDLGYKIHILYNVFAITADKVNATIDDQLGVEEFEWEITAVPEEIPGFAPTSHFIFDSTKTDPVFLQNIESMVWGNGNAEPDLPSLQDLAYFITEYDRVEIVDNGDGTWTANSHRPGYILFGTDGDFTLVNVNATTIDSDTYSISDTI